MRRIFVPLFALCGLLLAVPPALSGPVQVQAAHVDGVARPGPFHRHHPLDVGKAWPVSIGLKATPAPVPSPAPPMASYPAGVLSASQVASYAKAAGFPDALVPSLVAIAWRESNFCPRAVNGQGCVGTFVDGGPACSLWQLYPCPGPAAADPMVATWFAREKCLASIAAGLSCLRPWGG